MLFLFALNWAGGVAIFFNVSAINYFLSRTTQKMTLRVFFRLSTKEGEEFVAQL